MCICLSVHFGTTADCNLEFKGYLVSNKVSHLVLFTLHLGLFATQLCKYIQEMFTLPFKSTI